MLMLYVTALNQSLHCPPVPSVRLIYVTLNQGIGVSLMLQVAVDIVKFDFEVKALHLLKFRFTLAIPSLSLIQFLKVSAITSLQRAIISCLAPYLLFSLVIY
jgi:hypothetical protein